MIIIYWLFIFKKLYAIKMYNIVYTNEIIYKKIWKIKNCISIFIIFVIIILIFHTFERSTNFHLRYIYIYNLWFSCIRKINVSICRYVLFLAKSCEQTRFIFSTGINCGVFTLNSWVPQWVAQCTIGSNMQSIAIRINEQYILGSCHNTELRNTLHVFLFFSFH